MGYILIMIDSGYVHYIDYGDEQKLLRSKQLLQSSSTKRFEVEALNTDDDILRLRSDTEYITERFKHYLN